MAMCDIYVNVCVCDTKGMLGVLLYMVVETSDTGYMCTYQYQLNNSWKQIDNQIEAFIYHTFNVQHTSYFQVSCILHTVNTMLQLRMRLTSLTEPLSSPPHSFMFSEQDRDK